MFHKRFVQFFSFGALSLGLFCSSAANAALISYEGFDYGNSTLTGKTVNSTGWGGAWAAVSGSTTWNTSITNVGGTSANGSLFSAAYPANMPTTGGRIAKSGSGTFRNNRLLSTVLDLNVTQTVYISLLFRQTATGTSSGNLEFGLLRSDDGTGAADAADATGNMRFGLASNSSAFFLGSSSATFSPFTPALSTTYIGVLKIEANEDGDDKISAIIYRPSDTVPAIEPSSLDWHSSFNYTGTASLAKYDKIRVWAGTNTNGSFDEIRIGDTWLDVIPEPSTYTFAGLALCGLGFVGLRRRKLS